MKKTVYVILFCVGSILLLQLAYAAEPEFSGEMVLGGSMVTGRLSQLDAEEGNKRVDRLNGQSDKDTYLAPYVSGELAYYTLSNGRTTVFITRGAGSGKH